MGGEKQAVMLAQWFLSLPFTSVDPGSSPDTSLACGLGFAVPTWLPGCMGSNETRSVPGLIYEAHAPIPRRTRLHMPCCRAGI